MHSSTSQAPAASVGSREGATAATALQQKRDLKLYTAHELLLFTALALIVGVSAGYWSAIHTGSAGSATITASLATPLGVPPTASASAFTPATSTEFPKDKTAPVRRDASKAAPPPATKQKFALADLAAKFSIDVIDRVAIAPQVAALMPNIVISDADMDLGDNVQFSQFLAESPVLYSDVFLFSCPPMSACSLSPTSICSRSSMSV